MIIVMPPPPEGYSASAWRNILDFIKRSMIPVVSQNEAVSRILLRAPDGTIYAVTVDNSGTLTTAIEDGKSGP
jgi:hypothetical protein